jgi:hypothetical protein
MNDVNDILLDSFLEAPVKNAHQAPHPLERALLVSIGAVSASICQRTLTLATTWLGATPPVAHWVSTVSPGADPADAASGEGMTGRGAEDDALLAALDAIARRKVADDLRAAGYALQTTESLAVWIVADNMGGGLPDPTLIAATADNVRRLAWGRVRAEAAIRVLAVTEPADGAALATWQRQLPAGATAVYLSSPINLHHLRVDAQEHAEQSAVALAIFLCGNFPSHAQPGRDAGHAVGAAAWTAPRAAVRRGLALHSARHAVAAVQRQLALIADADGASEAPAGLTGRLPNLEQSDLDLASSAPPALPAARWRDFGVTWDDLDDLRRALQERSARRADRHVQSARAARCAWLDARMALWHALLSEVDQQQRSVGENAPRLRAYGQTLTGLRTRLQADLDALATALERSDLRVRAADEQVEIAWAQVEKVCGQLPRMTTKGIVYAALQPWMWPIWPYAFHTILAQEGQRLLDSMTYASKARWHEANWHILRQAMLAMSQDVHRRLHTLDKLRAALAALHTYLTDALAALPLPAPWTLATLRRVWADAQSQAPALTAFPVHLCPLDWSAEAPDQSGEQLITHFTAAADFVGRWTVLDFLAQPFLGAQAHSDDAAPTPVLETGAPLAANELPPACLTWLTDLVEAALPLWPDPAVTPTAGTVGWALLPPPAPGAVDSGYGPDALRYWREDVVNLAPATLAGQTLAILRWAPVEVIDTIVEHEEAM